MGRKGRATGLAAVAAACMAVAAFAWAQVGPPGGPGGGQGRGQQGRGSGRDLVPPGIDLILAYPPDNSLIVRDPPVEDPNAPRKVVVRPQWLEVVRQGPQLIVRRFTTVDSPEVQLISGQVGEVKVKTPTQTSTYPLQVTVGKDGIVAMTLFAPDRSGEVAYRLNAKTGVRLGESVVAKAFIYPQDDGQRETYLQFTFAAPAAPAPPPPPGEKPSPK